MRKKNKHTKISFRLFIAAVAIMLVGLGGYKLKKIAPDSVAITYHHVYSDMLKQELTQYIETEFKTKNFSGFIPALFAKNLKRNFTFVKKVLWNWDASGRATVTVEGVRPLFLVNDKFILGNKKRLFPINFFQNVSLDSLKSIQIASALVHEQKINASLYKFLRTVPDSYWDRYTMSCLGDHVVLDDVQSRLQILVDEKMLMDQHKMDFVLEVPTRVGKKYVTYDLRFKNCVCARHVGGSYGKKNAG